MDSNHDSVGQSHIALNTLGFYQVSKNHLFFSFTLILRVFYQSYKSYTATCLLKILDIFWTVFTALFKLYSLLGSLLKTLLNKNNSLGAASPYISSTCLAEPARPHSLNFVFETGVVHRQVEDKIYNNCSTYMEEVFYDVRNTN